MIPSIACSICGHAPLNSGPLGRKASTGLEPHCPQCESLERHRIIHRLMRMLPNGFLNWRWAITFSPDPSVDAKWFRHLEKSVFGGENSIDIQNIPRRDGSFDFISINHVLESVEDDRKAFMELARLLSPSGFMQVTYGNIWNLSESIDLPEPEMDWRAYHRYGMDVNRRFGTRELGLIDLVVVEEDPVTNAKETVHFYFRDPSDAARVRAWIGLQSTTADFLE